MMSTAPGEAADELLCDLHLHSTNSDGLASPEEIVALAKRAGLGVMCLSDHSRPTFTRRLCDLTARNGIVLLPGLEISTTHRGRKYHVLAYGRGVLEAGFQDFAFRPTAVKNRTYRRILADLRAEGMRLPSDADILAGVREGAPPLHPGKWMLNSTLIARYLAPVLGTDPVTAAALVKERYNALKGRESGRYVPTARTIAMARAAGAIPVIAHPFWECHHGKNSWDGVVTDLRSFAAEGLIGVEVSSRHDSPADEARREEAACRLALVPFRSSDFHANGKTQVGQFPMRAAHLIDAAARCDAAILTTAAPNDTRPGTSGRHAPGQMEVSENEVLRDQGHS